MDVEMDEEFGEVDHNLNPCISPTLPVYNMHLGSTLAEVVTKKASRHSASDISAVASGWQAHPSRVYNLAHLPNQASRTARRMGGGTRHERSL